MPSRYLRETYLTSPRINAVEPDVRDCWIRLLLVVDDHGRFYGDPQLIASRCYPLRPDAKKVERMLSDLARVDLIERYEVDGKRFVLLTQWKERVRSLPKYPAPACMTLNGDHAIPTASGDSVVYSVPSRDLQDDPVNGAVPSVANSCAQPPASADSCNPRANTRAFTVPIPITPNAPPVKPSAGKIDFDADRGWLGITDADRELWRKAYPSIDLDAQLARARVWVLSKKARKANWRKFLGNWFGTAQDSAGPAWSGDERRTWT